MRTFPDVRRGIGSATRREAEGAKRMSTSLSLRQKICGANFT